MVRHKYLPYLRIVGHVCLSQLAGTDWVLGGVCRYESRSDSGPSPSQCYTGAVLCCPVSHRCYSPYMVGAVLYRCYPCVSQVPRYLGALLCCSLLLLCPSGAQESDPGWTPPSICTSTVSAILSKYESHSNPQQIQNK